MEEAKVNALHHFDVDMSKFKDTAGYVVSIIKVSDDGRFALRSLALTACSEILQVTTLPYHLMAGGSTLKLGDAFELPSSYNRGQIQWITRRELVG